MPKPEKLVGKQIDQFKLEAYLARGAMGMVFRAFDSVLARTVALKLIPKLPDEDSDAAENIVREESRKRLIQEAKAAGKLAQPNIVTIHAYGETEEFQYICMEYISGKTLAQVLKERGKIPVEEAIPLFEQILLALEAADQEGIVHRDIKPANIMITKHNLVKVMDFGIAKLPSLSMTVTGMVLGTPYYMSPEQISGKKVDIRSDIFSLGAVIYEVLTGERPFDGENTATLTYKIIQVDPTPPNILNRLVPDSLAALIAKSLAKEPADRYQNPTEMLADLESLSQPPATGEETVVSQTAPDGTVVASAVEAPGTHREPERPVSHEPPVKPQSRPAPDAESASPGEAGGEDEERPAPSKSAGAEVPAVVRARSADALSGQAGPPKKPNVPLIAIVVILLVGGVAFGLKLLTGVNSSPPVAPQPPSGPVATAPGTVSPLPPASTPQAGGSLQTHGAPELPLPPPPQPPPQTETLLPLDRPPEKPAPSVEALRAEAGKSFTSDPEWAQKLLEQALALDPKDYDTSLALARLLSYRKDYPAAIRQYQQALQLNNRAPDVHYELGSLFLGQGDYDSAIQSLQSSLIHNPRNRDEVLANLGFCHMKKGETAQARSLFQQSLDLNSNNPTAKAFMASLPAAQPPAVNTPEPVKPPVAKPAPSAKTPPPPAPKKTAIEENLPGLWSYAITIQTGQTITGQVEIDDSGKKLKLVATAAYRLMGQDGVSHQFRERSVFFGSLLGQNLTALCETGQLTMDGRAIPIPGLPIRLSLVVNPEGRFMQGYVSNSQGVTTAVVLKKR